MSPIEERLSAALQARAEAIDLAEPAPGLPQPATPRRLQIVVVAAAAAVVAVVAMVAVATRNGDEVQPAPAPGVPTGTPTPGISDGPSRPAGTLQDPFVGDVDGDGVDDEVFVSDGVLAANLADGNTASQWIKSKRVKLLGLADVDSDRLLALLDDGRIFRFTASEKVSQVQTGGYAFALTWLDEDRRLLTGTEHEWDDKTYITAYRWTGEGRQLEPTGDAMYCPSSDPSGSPVVCGSGAKFVGDPTGLPELQPAPYSTVGVGEGDVGSGLKRFGGATAHLEGSTAFEVADGEVELVVDGARIALPGGGAPRILFASFPAGDGVAFAIERGIGDSYGYELYRYDGTELTPMAVAKVDGLDLHGGGAAGGGPYVEVSLSSSNGFYTLRSESGRDLYQKAVSWQIDGDRMVGTEIGPVCLDTLVLELDVPDAYGACDFG